MPDPIGANIHEVVFAEGAVRVELSGFTVEASMSCSHGLR